MPSTRTVRLGSLLSALNRELQQSDYCFCSSKRKKKTDKNSWDRLKSKLWLFESRYIGAEVGDLNLSARRDENCNTLYLEAVIADFKTTQRAQISEI